MKLFCHNIAVNKMIMCAKLHTNMLLLLSRLSGAYSIIQIYYYLQVSTHFIVYLLFTSHGTIAYIDNDFD